MNTVETIPRLERKFDQDRVDNEPLPSSHHATNALRTTQSAPIKSIPRDSILVRAATSLLTSTADKGVMDMWVDDGTNGNIDNTVRLLRFSTAASAIDGLFHSPKRSSRASNPFAEEKATCDTLTPENNTDLCAQASGKPFVTSDAPKTNFETLHHTEDNSNGQEKGSEAAAGVIISRKEAESIVKSQIDILETEPITPLLAVGNRLGGEIDSSENPSPAKAPDLADQNPVHATDGTVGMEASKESASPIGRRLSAFFLAKGKTTENSVAPQSSTIEQGQRNTKRESSLLFKNVFKRRSVRAVETPPHLDVDQVDLHSIQNQPAGRRTATVFTAFEPKSLQSSSSGQSAVAVVEKQLRHEEQDKPSQHARPAKRSKSEPLGNNAYGGRSPIIFNFLKKRATAERPLPLDAGSASGQNDVGPNEQSELPTDRSARKLAKLMKKLSSGFAEKETSNSRAARKPRPTAVQLTTSPICVSHSEMPDACESPVSERNHKRYLSHELKSSCSPTNETPEQMTKSDSVGQTSVTKRDRESLWRLLKRFSSRSKDSTSETDAKAEEVGHETHKRGAFFARLFKRKSTNPEEKQSETENASCPKEGDAGDTPDTPTPPMPTSSESQARWRQLPQKVTRFLGMLVH